MSLIRVIRTVTMASLAVAVLASPAFARVKSARGNIESVDLNVMQIAIKGVDGKVNTFRLRQDAGVKFSDGAESHASSALKDLAAPMYVWFDFEDFEGKEPGLIQKIDVRDMPAAMREVPTDGSATLTASQRQLRVRLQTLNTSSGQFKADVAGRSQTFRATSGSMLSSFREGDLVVITIERVSGQDRVTNVVRSTSAQ
jgi:Cu/Ag efflux protein CusF